MGFNKLNLKNTIRISGGKTRQESTFNALIKLKKMNCKKVLIHDAARPLPLKKNIREIISKLKKHHAVIPVINVNDATKRIEKKTIFKNIQRHTFGLAQTPQGFTFNKIFEKHRENKNEIFV